MARKIAYEPHPVSPERKAELLDKGYKIIDVRFKPAGEPAAEPAAEPKAVANSVKTGDNVKKGKPRKVGTE